MKPEIYILNRLPILGEIVQADIVNNTILCNICNMKEPIPKWTNVVFQLDQWHGEDFLGGMFLYLVSEKLKNALMESKLIGFEFEPVKMIYSGKKEIPQFFQLKILGQALGTETWWIQTPCKICDKKKWLILAGGIAANNSFADPNNIPSRNVYGDSWKEESIFYLQDPAPPIVTQDFINILKKFKCKPQLIPSNWI